MSSTTEEDTDPKGYSQLRETNETTVGWYDPEPRSRLTPAIQAFFSNYCHLEGDALLEHLHAIHKRAWSTRPYPCVGQWGFLNPTIAQSPACEPILQRLKRGGALLDLGCCMGQDLRYLAAAGAPTERMYGADIEPAFWELGLELFKDHDSSRAQWLLSDILDDDETLPEGGMRNRLHGSLDAVWASCSLHLWDRETQLHALKALIRLARVDAVVAGMQVGRQRGVEVVNGWGDKKKTMFFHDATTMQDMWRQAAQQTDTEWKVEARLSSVRLLLPEERDSAWMAPESGLIWFEATRSR